jgi:hypothetical protein
MGFDVMKAFNEHDVAHRIKQARWRIFDEILENFAMTHHLHCEGVGYKWA